MHEKLKKLTSVGLIPIVLIATVVTTTMLMGFAIPFASAVDPTSRDNVTNTQHNWSGGGGAPSSWSPATCEAGSCTVYYNATIYDRNNAVGNENDDEGAMGPMNHTIWIHVNDTANTTWDRNFTGDAGPTSNGVFTVTRADITDYGKVNVSYEFSVPAGWNTGRHYTNFNTTDNATTFTSVEIWSNDTYITVTGEGITAQLLDEDGNDENIDAGYWGNVTLTPGGTNVEFDVNYLRGENTGTYPSQQVTVNFVGNTWDSAKVGDSIDIDTNIEWAWVATNYSADNPGNSFTSEGSTWSGWLSDTTGSYEFRFFATGEYLWIKIRILAVPSPLGGADDYTATYTTTASGVA